MLVEEGLVVHFVLGAETVGRHGHHLYKEDFIRVFQNFVTIFFGLQRLLVHHHITVNQAQDFLVLLEHLLEMLLHVVAIQKVELLLSLDLVVVLIFGALANEEFGVAFFLDGTGLGAAVGTLVGLHRVEEILAEAGELVVDGGSLV